MNHKQHTYLRSLDVIKQYCKSERLKGLMIVVNARKAFDSVDHNYMQGVLEAYTHPFTPNRDFTPGTLVFTHFTSARPRYALVTQKDKNKI